MSASRFTIFMLLEALPSWLSLDRTARGKIAEEALGSGISGFNVTHRHFDAEASAAAAATSRSSRRTT